MSITLATVATQFLDRPGLAEKTVESYEFTLLPLVRQYGSWPIEAMDREILEDYLNSLTHLAYTTHQRHQTVIQALFNFAVEQQLIRANPITRLKRRKPDPAKGEHRSDQTIRYLTSEQLSQLYAAVRRDYRTYTIVRLLHRTGARISELLSLDLADMDLEHQKFQVIGKGNKQRWCFYSDDAALLLAKYLKNYRHGEHHPGLFTAQQPFSQTVSRVSYRTVHQDWKRLIAGIPELEGTRLHDLRHTFATERVGLMGIEELRALMGHQTIQTTLRYQKVTSQRAETVAQNAFKTLVTQTA
ncbi:MAG: tyrosine-type recombinase/integrase [Acaryochloridaceae cyanobacterium CSU_3_4]|nr:tyrosine-type recombinase/integrase [Acaryochloridaceae cyanobacterium CSU_3_4]